MKNISIKNIPKFLRKDPLDSDLSVFQTTKEDMSMLWVYRILVDGQGYKTFLRQNDFSDDKLAVSLDFGEYIFNDAPKIFNASEIKNKLFKQADKAEKDKLKFLYQDIHF